MVEPQTSSEAAVPAGRASSLMRSGMMMAVGTLASRLTGFLRTIVIVAALGTAMLGNVYNTANTIPNIVYDLLLGGILTSVIVPLLVQAKERDRAYGEKYEQRVFTAAVIFLAAITLTAVALAPVLISIYGGKFAGPDRHLAVLFAWFFLPQIFFYGVGAFAGAILNTRDSFVAPMWAPVLNNVVVIAIGVVFVLTVSGEPTPANLGNAEMLLLALGTTGGIVLQTVALWPSLRKVGFHWHPQLKFQPGELALVGRTAVWTLVYVILTQIGFAVVTRLINSTSVEAAKEGLSSAYGFTSYATAYQFFQLPYAIVAVSVITALLPRMSRHAAEGEIDLVRDDFSSGLRLSSVLIIPGAVLMIVLSSDIAVVLFEHRAVSHEKALIIGRIMQMLAVALVPFSAYQLMLRVFYSFRDTRTPALIAGVTVAVNVIAATVAYLTLPTKHIVVGIAGAFVLTNIVGAVVCVLVLRRRLGRMDGGRLLRAYVKMFAAAGPLAAFAWGCQLGMEKWAGSGLWSSLAAVVVGGVGGGILYLITARLLRISEVETMISTLSARIPGLR